MLQQDVSRKSPREHIRVVIVDDHALVRSGLRFFLLAFDDLELVGDLCLDHGARDVLVAQDRHTRDRLWEARRMIIEALNHASPVNHLEDLVVPRARISRWSA